MERFIEKNGKKMRYGYTTGSCAAAASKAAVIALFEDSQIDYMTIDTPKGWMLDIEIEHIQRNHYSATSAVVKDSGDDPDVTDGMKVFATAFRSPEKGIRVEGGIGIGRVTKKGLRVPVGEAAINPVPMQMIKEEVGKVLPENEGVTLVIFAPEGVELAKRTFNLKLGIIGGLSVLGTSGIVEPMSEDAFKESLRIELSVKKAAGAEEIIFVFGNFGRDYLDSVSEFIDLEEQLQKTSNFVAYMLKSAAELGFKRILYVGHAGKMVKVAAGMKNTHSKYGDNRMTSILNCAQEVVEKQRMDGSKMDIPEDLTFDEVYCGQLMEANTTDEAVEILDSKGIRDVTFQRAADKCKEVCESMTGGAVKVECIIFTTIYGKLAQTEGAEGLLEAMHISKSGVKDVSGGATND